jgi:hypothetical protein
MSSTTTGSVVLTAPSQGTYKGVVAFQDRSSSAPNTITGNGNVNISGTVYTPAAPISIVANNTKSGGGNNAAQDNIGSQIIANTVAISGVGSFTVNNTNATPVRLIQLIE